MRRYDVIIVGGGLAGLTAALHLSAEGIQTLLIEKHPYPRHKVCGEYLSNEVRPYLEYLGMDLGRAVPIDTLQLSSHQGRSLTTRLPLGGMGISRHYLDASLYEKALSNGVEVVIEPVKEIINQADSFSVATENASYSASIVLGAYGKRSGLDKQLERPFTDRNYPWLAVKAHYKHPDWPTNQVGLHAFSGGYAGISQTESGLLNFCYLASYKSFKTQGSVEKYTREVVGKNPIIRKFLAESEMTFKDPLTIAQIAFQKKGAVVNGILMCGDTAGMIHPLCGNGMAMAIHSAKLASNTIVRHLGRPNFNLARLGREYESVWRQTFSGRLAIGRFFQNILLREKPTATMIKLLARSPGLVRSMIRATHGKPITYD